MPQITIKFEGDEAEEAKEAFFDWWETEGRDNYCSWCDTQELGVTALNGINSITIET